MSHGRGGRFWARVSGRLALAALLCRAGDARADDVSGHPEPAPPGHAEVPVTIAGTRPLLLVELYAPRAAPGLDLPIARCRTPCVAHLVPGRYRLAVAATDETLDGSRSIQIEGSSELEVDPDSASQRTTGLVLGIGGPVASMLGAVLLLSNVCIDSCSHENGGAAAAGALVMLGGMVVTPIGWILFARSFAPEVEMRPLGGHEPTAFAGRPLEHARPVGLGFGTVF